MLFKQKLVVRLITFYVLLGVCVLIAPPANAECGSDEITAAALRADPDLQEALDLHEKSLQNVIDIRNSTIVGNTRANIRYIPVVVHILFENAAENVSDAQVLSMINVLNEDFRRIPGSPGFNTHPDGADVEVEFRLTDTDPNGNPTTGITRTSTTVQAFDLGNPSADQSAEGGLDAWDVSRYLNIYICDLVTGLSGLAPQPGLFELHENRDNVVIDFTAAGDNVGTVLAPRQFGHNAAHEVGHFLDLFHTFRGNCLTLLNCRNHGDKCCDTPKSTQSTSGCPTNQQRCNRSTQIENYLDYTDDACKNMFTNDQSDRMNALLHLYRRDLVQPGLIPGDDFFIFGEHEGDYNYVSTSRLIARGTAPYDEFVINQASSAELRARTEVVLEPGFVAAGADVNIFIDSSVPMGKRAFADGREGQAEQFGNTSLSLTVAPQPFTESTRVEFRLKQAANVSAAIFDIHGRKVADVLPAGNERAGLHSFEIDASSWTAGVYVLNLCVDGECASQQLLKTQW